MRWCWAQTACWFGLVIVSSRPAVTLAATAKTSARALPARGVVPRLVRRRPLAFGVSAAAAAVTSGLLTFRFGSSTSPPHQKKRQAPLTAMRASSSGIIDSHLHVWSPSQKALARPAPPGLDAEEASPDSLRQLMAQTGVAGAVIVQPINYEFDHSYVASVIADAPSMFVGVLLANPKLDPEDLEREIRELHAQGFTGVRLNPSLFDDPEHIDDAKGRALFEVCADLAMPIGVMAFANGFSESLKTSLDALLELRPDAIVVLDHFGFPRANPAAPPSPELQFDEEAFERVLDFSRHAYAHVKLSALFRVSSEEPPYNDLKPRVKSLLERYGSRRLLWGSDFPFVELSPNGGYEATLNAVRAWLLSDDDGESGILNEALKKTADTDPLHDDAAANVLGENAARLYRLNLSGDDEGVSS